MTLGKNQAALLKSLLHETRRGPYGDYRDRCRFSAGSLGGGLNDSQCRTAIKGLRDRGLVESDHADGFSTWGTQWRITPAGVTEAESC